MGSSNSKKARAKAKAKAIVKVKAGPSAKPEFNPITLASETSFSVNEVESLYELYKKLSSSVVEDGLIHKEELRLALFQNISKQNLFFDRIFDLFDVNNNGHIEFGEFVHTLNVFHPKTPDEVKIRYAFKLYDLRHTGFIEREELKEMVVALLNESDLILTDDIVEMIVNKTFMEADGKADGRIDEEEWKEYVGQNPSLLKNMTLPYLMGDKSGALLVTYRQYSEICLLGKCLRPIRAISGDLRVPQHPFVDIDRLLDNFYNGHVDGGGK